MAFTLKERQIMGIHGLLPPTVFNQDQQEERIVDNFHRWDDDLDKFIYLTALQDRNEKLFYKVRFIVFVILMNKSELYFIRNLTWESFDH